MKDIFKINFDSENSISLNFHTPTPDDAFKAERQLLIGSQTEPHLPELKAEPRKVLPMKSSSDLGNLVFWWFFFDPENDNDLCLTSSSSQLYSSAGSAVNLEATPNPQSLGSKRGRSYISHSLTEKPEVFFWIFRSLLLWTFVCLKLSVEKKQNLIILSCPSTSIVKK